MSCLVTLALATVCSVATPATDKNLPSPTKVVSRHVQVKKNKEPSTSSFTKNKDLLKKLLEAPVPAPIPLERPKDPDPIAPLKSLDDVRPALPQSPSKPCYYPLPIPAP